MLPGQRATRDIKVGNEVIVRKNRKFTRAAIRKLKEANLDRLPIDPTELAGKISAEDVIDEETGEVLLAVNEELTEDKLEALRKAKIEQFKVLFIDGLNVGSYLRDTLVADKIKTEEEAILEIYRRLRPGDPPTLETARTLLNNLFFNPERYDLSRVGRLEAELQVLQGRQGQGPARDPGPDQAGHHRDGPPPDPPEEHPRHGRRHRPPRQPPRARGRRADGESVPHRPRAHGARDQRAHEHVSGARDADAARPDQREARERGGQGVLRLAASSRSSWTRPTRCPR